MNKEIVIRCKRCNGRLRANESIDRGYGRKCYKLYRIEMTKPYFIDDEINLISVPDEKESMFAEYVEWLKGQNIKSGS